MCLDHRGVWRTTLVGRVCLHMLASRNARREDPMVEAFVPDPVITSSCPWCGHRWRCSRGARHAPLLCGDPDRAAQQRRVDDRFPSGSRFLFPGWYSNLNGSRPVSDSWCREQMESWLARIRLIDEHGRPARVTFHQFRHTLGTRLINADVPQHIVQQVLDHMSPQMTAVHARLHQKTLREHWEKALKVNTEGQPVVLPADHPLADATWMRLSLVRAKVSLPNGYCGAPVQTDCQYANPCLDCRFFITTGDFLDQHRRQREETSRLIEDAEKAGLSRIVEKNTRTLGKLDTIIAALEQAGPEQIVAGGKVTDLDATG